MKPELPRPGVGAVYCACLHSLFEAHPDVIQVAEIEPSSFWIKAPGPRGAIRSNPRALERIAALPQTKLVHGVGYPVGGIVCDNDVHVDEMRRWADRLGAPWTSEHLSFNETAAGAAGFLLPPCQSDDGVAVAAANIRARAAAIGRPFAFETGVSYLPPGPDEMEDGAFLAAVAEAADCHILLDLHNLWTNELNGRARVHDVVAALPLDRVCEVHLAGGDWVNGYWLDAHSGLVPLALLDLAAEIMPALPALGAILFEISPEYARKAEESALLRQIEALHPLWERRGTRPRRAPPLIASSGRGGGRTEAAWEAAFIAALSRRPAGDADPAIALYNSLIDSFRSGALAVTLTHSIRLLQLAHGEAAAEDLLADYSSATSPQLYPGDEAIQFAAWLKANGPSTPYLDDVLALEEGIVTIACAGAGRELGFAHDPTLIVLAIAEGRVPHDLPAGDYRIALGSDIPAPGGGLPLAAHT